MSFASDYEKLRKKRLEEEEKKNNAAMGDIAPIYSSFNFNPFDVKANTGYTNKNYLSDTITKEQKENEEKQKDNVWFKAGAFEDGYQFGDVMKTGLATIGDVAVGVGEGVMKSAEGISDLILHGASWGAKKVGWEDLSYDLQVTALDNTMDNMFEHIDDSNSLLGEKGHAIPEGLGQIAFMYLTGSAGGTALSTAANFASATGSGVSEAYNSGATEGEAWAYGAMSGAVEAGSELIFGGLGKTVNAIGVSKGISSLDDMFAKKVSSKISSQFWSNAAELGIKAGAEGTEEVISGIGSAVAKKLTYMSDEELMQLVEDENLLEQFITGAVTSGIAQSGFVPGTKSGSFAEATAEGRDFITGLTESESKVADFEYQKRVAAEEADGNKLKAKEKNKIYDEVVEDVKKGYISTDTIEEVLGGDSYKTYKDTIDGEETAINKLRELYEGDELDAAIKDIRDNSKSGELKYKLGEDVLNQAIKGKDSYLVNSYAERAKRGQAFEADLDSYTNEHARQTIKNIMESGVANNTGRMHDFANNVLAKISADKGIVFSVTDAKKLSETSFAVEGKTVNGYVTEDGITINIDSPKYLNTVVGHEITHVLEGTEFYNTLKDTILEYAEAKGEYHNRFRDTHQLYKGVEGYAGVEGLNKVEKEVVADLVGDYLFDDPDFISHLSTKDRNVFQKLYDEIKYLYNLATAGSKEKRQLERVKKAFEDAYRANGKVDGDTKNSTKYSLGLDNRQNLVYNEERGETYARTDEFRNLQEESRRMSDEEWNFYLRGGENEVVRRRVASVLQRQMDSIRRSGGFNNGVLTLSGKENQFNIYEDVDGSLFHDCFEIARKHLRNGELVDLHAVETTEDGVGYNDCYNYLSDDGLSGFSITPDGDLISVFNASEKGGFLRAISGIVKEKAKTLDCFASPNQNLMEMYEKVFGFKTASVMDYNMDYDHDNIAVNHGEPQIAFMVNSESDVEVRNFSKDEYEEAVEYRNSFVNQATSDKVASFMPKTAGDNDVKYSLSEDSEGRKLSDNQSKYFKGSKVVDDNGDLKVVYHGSPASFNEFSLKYLGTNGTNEGYGFYFTDSKRIAEGYSKGREGQQNGESGKLFEVYLDIKKPLSDTKVTMSRNQFKKLLIELNNRVDADGERLDILSNYGDVEWEGLNKVLNYAMEIEYDGSDSDVNMVHSLINGCGDMKAVFEELRKVTGYDGIIVNEATWGGDQTIYIAFHPEQIKNVDNMNPTSDPDIRRSLSEKGETPRSASRYGVKGEDVKLQTAPIREDIAENATTTDAQKSDARRAAEYRLEEIKRESEEFGIDFEYQKMLSQIEQKNMASAKNALGVGYHIQKKSNGKYVAYVEGEGSGFVANKFEVECDTFDEAYLAIQEHLLKDSPDTVSSILNDYENVAPVNERTSSKMEQVAPEDAMPEGFAPMSEEEAHTLASENLASLDDSDAPMESDTEYYDFADTSSIGDTETKRIADSLVDVLALDEKDIANAEDIIQRYSKGEIQSEDALFDELGEKFREKTEVAGDDERLVEIKRYIKKQPIFVSDTVKRGINEYRSFMRSNFGKIRFSKNGSNIDSVYMELSELYPQYFPEDIINQEDQLLQIAAVVNMDHKIYDRYALSDGDIQAAVDTIVSEVGKTKEAGLMAAVEADRQALMNDIAPVIHKKGDTAYEAIRPKKPGAEPRMKRIKEGDIAPTATYETAKKGQVEGQRTMFAEGHTAEVYDTEPEVPKKKNKGWSKFLTNFVDKQSVFEKLSLKTKNRELMSKANFMLSSESRAQRMIGHGIKSQNIKSLDSIRAEVESTGKTKEFYEYMYHRHNIDRMNLDTRYEDMANKPVFGDSVTAEVSQSIVDQYEAKNPAFKEYAENVYSYMNYLRKQLVDNGVISSETAALWAEMYPHYVPIRRLGDSGLNINVPLDTGKTGINAPIKRATGGNRDILPLFDTMAMRTEQTFKAVAKNSFGVELKNTLGTTIESTATDLDGVIDSVDKHEELLQEGKNGQNPTFTVFENGERVTFEISEEMYDALKPTSKGLAYTNKVANKVSNWHRGILTEYNPVFMASNAIKDAQDVLINSQHPAKTYAKLPQAYTELATKGKWYTEYMENGGEQNTYFDGQSHTFKANDSKIKKVIGMPLNAIKAANNFVERAPRLAEYIASRESGASVETAMLDAARVTTNFQAGGDVTKFLNRNGATFLNASVQGFNQQVRNIREAKANGLKGWVQLAAKFTIAGLPALLLNNLVWKDDEEYEELSDYVKDNYYIVAKYGDGKFVRIPKGRTVAVIQNAFTQISNAITGDDEVDLKNFLDLAISNLAPNNPIDNNIIAPIAQAVSNKTWYGEDLVPTRLQDLPAAEQYDESTDAFSKWLGEKTNISPYKINYILDQYSGGVGDVVLPMMTPEAERGDNSVVGNAIAPIKDKFTTDSTMNNQNVSDFYDTMDKLTTNAKSSKATDEDILKYKYMNAINSELSTLYQQKREIQNSDLSDSEKYEAVREIQEQIVSITRDSLNSYEDVTIEGVYASVGDVQFRWYEPGEDSEAEAGWRKLSADQLEKQDEVTSGLGITPSEYWSNKTEYDFAYENPGKHAVSKALGGYESYKTYSSELYDIKADKDSSGKSITGSRKEKVIEYVNSLDVDYGVRLILFKSEYNADDTYNYEIIDYLNNRQDISYEEMATILKELGFTVDKNGNISW